LIYALKKILYKIKLISLSNLLILIFLFILIIYKTQFVKP